MDQLCQHKFLLRYQDYLFDIAKKIQSSTIYFLINLLGLILSVYFMTVGKSVVHISLWTVCSVVLIWSSVREIKITIWWKVCKLRILALTGIAGSLENRRLEHQNLIVLISILDQNLSGICELRDGYFAMNGDKERRDIITRDMYDFGKYLIEQIDYRLGQDTNGEP